MHLGLLDKHRPGRLQARARRRSMWGDWVLISAQIGAGWMIWVWFRHLLALPRRISEIASDLAAVPGKLEAISGSLADLNAAVAEIRAQAKKELDDAQTEHRAARATEDRIRRALRSVATVAGGESEDGSGGMRMPEEGAEAAQGSLPFDADEVANGNGIAGETSVRARLQQTRPRPPRPW